MPNFDLLSVPYLSVLIAYFFVSSIKMFDLRMTQAREGKLGPDMTLAAQTEPPLPKWLEYFYVIDWLLGITLLILNWKITLPVFVIRFILKVLPVLETVGNLLVADSPELGKPGKIPGSRKLIAHEGYRLVYGVDGDHGTL